MRIALARIFHKPALLAGRNLCGVPCRCRDKPAVSPVSQSAGCWLRFVRHEFVLRWLDAIPACAKPRVCLCDARRRSGTQQTRNSAPRKMREIFRLCKRRLWNADPLTRRIPRPFAAQPKIRVGGKACSVPTARAVTDDRLNCSGYCRVIRVNFPSSFRGRLVQAHRSRMHCPRQAQSVPKATRVCLPRSSCTGRSPCHPLQFLRMWRVCRPS